MSFLPIKLDGAQAFTNDGYPPGDYLFEIVNVEQRQLDSGVGQLKVKTQIIAGPNGSTQMQGKAYTDSFLLTENAKGFLMALVQACGLTGAHVDQGGPQSLVGRQFVANLFQKKAQNGNEYDTLRKYRPANAWTHGAVAGAAAPVAAQPSMLQQLPVQTPVAAAPPVVAQPPVAAPVAAPAAAPPAPVAQPQYVQQAPAVQQPVQQAPAGFPAPPPPPGTVPQQ